MITKAHFFTNLKSRETTTVAGILKHLWHFVQRAFLGRAAAGGFHQTSFLLHTRMRLSQLSTVVTSLAWKTHRPIATLYSNSSARLSVGVESTPETYHFG